MVSRPIEPSQETLTDIRNRLGPVCKDYTAEEFAALVRQIAAVRAKYDALRTEMFMEAARRLALDQNASRDELTRTSAEDAVRGETQRQ